VDKSGGTGSSAGFTLVEALASLAILALVSLMLVAGTGFARARLSRLQAADDGEIVEAAQDLLRARLTHAFPYARTASGVPRVEFDGLPDRLDFYGPPPDADAPDALQHYVLGVTTAGVLQLTRVSDLANEPAASTKGVALLRGVTGIAIDYFGAAPPDNRPRWRERWEQQDTLPRLVRLRVGFASGDRRIWPDLIVAPAATLDSLCEIEANSGACRGRS
jgi:general secretion pathway protein J